MFTKTILKVQFYYFNLILMVIFFSYLYILPQSLKIYFQTFKTCACIFLPEVLFGVLFNLVSKPREQINS